MYKEVMHNTQRAHIVDESMSIVLDIHIAAAGLGPSDGFTGCKAQVGNPPRTADRPSPLIVSIEE